MHSFVIFQLISAGSRVSILVIGRGGEGWVPLLKPELNPSPQMGCVAWSGLDQPHSTSLQGSLQGSLLLGSVFLKTSARLQTKTLTVFMRMWLPSCSCEPAGAFAEAVRFQAHLSGWCMPSYRWFPAQQLVLFHCLPWVFTPSVQHTGTFPCCFWPFIFHPSGQILKHQVSQHLAWGYHSPYIQSSLE